MTPAPTELVPRIGIFSHFLRSDSLEISGVIRKIPTYKEPLVGFDPLKLWGQKIITRPSLTKTCYIRSVNLLGKRIKGNDNNMNNDDPANCHDLPFLHTPDQPSLRLQINPSQHTFKGWQVRPSHANTFLLGITKQSKEMVKILLMLHIFTNSYLKAVYDKFCTLV